MTILSTTRSQYNINRAMAAWFWPDCYFSRSVGRRPIFLTLNKVVNLPSGHLTIVAGRLFGHRPISSSNDQIFGRCPAGVPAAIVGTPGGHRWESCRVLLIFFNQSVGSIACYVNRQVGTLNAINHCNQRWNAGSTATDSDKNVMIPVRDCVQTIKRPNCAIEFLLILWMI